MRSASGGRETAPARTPVSGSSGEIAEAESVAELKRLLAAPSVPRDSQNRVRRTIADLRKELRHARERLASVRDVPDPDGGPAWLQEKKALAESLEHQRELDALLRGDYVFGTYRGQPSDRFEFAAWSRSGEPPEYTLLCILPRDEPPIYRQLLREIDHHEKVTAFNRMPESTRRRVLSLREESLLEDPPEDRRWLRDYFPEAFRIDAGTARIW